MATNLLVENEYDMARTMDRLQSGITFFTETSSHSHRGDAFGTKEVG
jgi:hypothetical protein